MLYSKFASVVNRYSQPSSGLVVALSGGLDSRVLLQLSAEYKSIYPATRLLAVHVHHGLSDNAGQWVKKCQGWCQKLGIELVVEYVQLSQAKQISVEQEAREKRYQALAKHVQADDILLTGQHASDQSETFLLALKRGSGPKGLSSMPEVAPFSQGYLVRPLLTISRNQVLAYANDTGLDWIEDESNSDIQYDRNFLRHKVIPKLEQRWPYIEQSIARSAKLCADQEQLLSQLLSEKLTKLISDDRGLDIQQLAGESELARNQLIRMWLDNQSSLMPSSKQLTLIWEEVALARQDATPKLCLASGEVRRYKKRLYFVKPYSDISQWRAPISCEQGVMLPDQLGSLSLQKVETGKGTLRVPTQEERVQVHFNPQGLVGHPVTREHSRSLKKLFQEYNVPTWLRSRTPIVMYGNKLAMVVGLFVDKACAGHEYEIVWDKVTINNKK